MRRSDLDIQSFIVKIWLEETAEEANQAIWRGHITHVPSGERRYFQNLDEIVAFVTSYLERVGVKIHKPRRLKLWLDTVKGCLRRRDG